LQDEKLHADQRTIEPEHQTNQMKTYHVFRKPFGCHLFHKAENVTARNYPEAAKQLNLKGWKRHYFTGKKAIARVSGFDENAEVSIVPQITPTLTP